MAVTTTIATGLPTSAEPGTTSASTIEPGRRWRIRPIVWAIGIIVIGAMLISVMLPSLCRAREPANRIKCASNLRQIGQAIWQYAQANSGHYPPSLAILLKQGDLATDVMVCPSSNELPASATDAAGAAKELETAEKNEDGHESCLSYIYVGRGQTIATVSENTIVAYEPMDNHNDAGTNVLFGDGHVEWMTKQTWPKVAATAGVAVVPSLTVLHSR